MSENYQIIQTVYLHIITCHTNLCLLYCTLIFAYCQALSVRLSTVFKTMIPKLKNFENHWH
jgi:hypothetical protein